MAGVGGDEGLRSPSDPMARSDSGKIGCCIVVASRARGSIRARPARFGACIARPTTDSRMRRRIGRLLQQTQRSSRANARVLNFCQDCLEPLAVAIPGSGDTDLAAGDAAALSGRVTGRVSRRSSGVVGAVSWFARSIVLS